MIAYIFIGLVAWYIIGCISIYCGVKYSKSENFTWGEMLQWGVLGLIGTAFMLYAIYEECDVKKDTHIIAKLKKLLTSSIRSK